MADSSPQKERRKPVLIVQHAHYEHPAALRRALEAQGIQSHWIHPYRGDPFPALEEVRGILSLGGPMGANDEEKHPWILPELDLLRASVLSGRPTVGICLGGQMMARALGSRVVKAERVELGWFKLDLLPEANRDRILGSVGKEPTVYQWHEDTFHLPDGATLLATSAACPRQAYRVGENAWGFQFHPEADHQLVHEWLAVEGIDDEIQAALDRHGPETVQTAENMRLRAREHERHSLRIASAISEVFNTRPYHPLNETLRTSYETWIREKTLLLIEFEDSNRRLASIKGTLAALLDIGRSDFLMFREENGILWPVRADRVRRLLLA
jgi:GMP synthase (glutamine-hydrolysing)